MLKILNSQEAFDRLRAHQFPARKYAAMYSSWLGGIVTDPNLMVLPIDDHGFHRGDAVFEAAKAVNGKIYALDRHLDRMHVSAEKIGLKLPSDLREIAIETTRASRLTNCILRYYVSRGPGGFTTNPYESIGAQTYLVITPLTPPAASKYENGVSAKTSSISIKEGVFSTVKSCNYLPNVMMKKEAVDSGVDFTVSVDESGVIGEGSTENFAIISKEGIFKIPSFERTLRGITLIRMMELSQERADIRALIKGVEQGPIKQKDIFEAREAMFFGTTLDCLPCSSFDSKQIGSGKRGEIAFAFQKALVDDIESGPLSILI
jgi:branched-subunit amino acid aminotransferase/4-amino-4-deoxychorismate lyase